MKKEEFVRMINEEMKALKEDKKLSVCIYVDTQENADELYNIIHSDENFDKNYDGYIDDAPFKIKWYWDENEVNFVWLYKYSSIGSLIQGLYGLPYPEHCALKGLLLGDSLKDIEEQYWADDKEHEEEFDFYSDYLYKPIHPEHRTYDKVIFDDENRDNHAPHTHAKYWEDTGNPNMPEFIEVEE